MKTQLGTVGALVLVAMAGVAVVACSSTTDKQGSSEGPSKSGERVGNVRLGLVPVPGITLESVNFVVSQGAATVSSGVLPTPGTSDSFSFGLPLPVGTAYSLSLSAVSAETGDDVTCTGAFGPFDVLPNVSTAFNLSLSCINNTNGQIVGGVDVETDSCPQLVVDYVVAIPATAAVAFGGIALTASARDTGNPSATITYSWSIADAAVGDFTPATGSSTTLNCIGFGDNVEVSVTADNGTCDTVLTTTVSCTSGDFCGDGIVDPAAGETCDPALDPTCPSDCNSVCGDGVAEGAEQCDIVPANLAVCSATCEIISSDSCGDGIITPPEVCDPPGLLGVGLGVCDPGCLTTSPIFEGPCGDGVVSSVEECDTAGSTPSCSGECESVSDEACFNCEQAGDCFEFSDNCNAFTGADKTLCYDVTQCIQATNCFDGTGTLGSCFCGTLPIATCGASPLNGPGSPNGACKDLILAGVQPVATSAQVLGLLTATSRPGGGAMARLLCQKNANLQLCLDSCGFTAGGPAFP